MTFLNVPHPASAETEAEIDAQQNTGLSSQNPVKEWEEWQYEQRDQDHDGDTHWNSLPELIGVHQLQPDKEGTT